MKKALFIITLLLSTGCASLDPIVIEKGAEIDKEQINDTNIKPGLTTKENIIMLFGEPYSVINLGRNNEKMVYKHDVLTKPQKKIFGQIVVDRERITRKTTTFDIYIEKGFVTRYNYHFEEK